MAAALLASSLPTLASADYVSDRIDQARSDSKVDRLKWELEDVNRNLGRLSDELRMRRSLRTYRSLSNIRVKTRDKLRSLGIEAFLPTNEGAIRAGKTKVAQCPANAHTVQDYCECDEGYIQNGALKKCVKKFQLNMTMSERKKAFDDFIKKVGVPCPDGPIPAEFTAAKYMCEVVNPYR